MSFRKEKLNPVRDHFRSYSLLLYIILSQCMSTQEVVMSSLAENKALVEKHHTEWLNEKLEWRKKVVIYVPISLG